MIRCDTLGDYFACTNNWKIRGVSVLSDHRCIWQWALGTWNRQLCKFAFNLVRNDVGSRNSIDASHCYTYLQAFEM